LVFFDEFSFMNFKNNFLKKKKLGSRFGWPLWRDSAGGIFSADSVFGTLAFKDVLTPERTDGPPWWWILPGSLRPIGSARDKLHGGIGHQRHHLLL
jgi:hypothetical protein